jgi:hypothetical protein
MSEGQNQEQRPKLINIQIIVTDERLTGTDKAQTVNNVSFPAEYVDTGQAAQIANAVAFVGLQLGEVFNQKFLAARGQTQPPPQNQ